MTQKYTKVLTASGLDHEAAEFIATTLATTLPRDVAALRERIEASLPDDVRLSILADKQLQALVAAFAQGTVEFLAWTELGRAAIEAGARG